MPDVSDAGSDPPHGADSNDPDLCPPSVSQLQQQNHCAGGKSSHSAAEPAMPGGVSKSPSSPGPSSSTSSSSPGTCEGSEPESQLSQSGKRGRRAGGGRHFKSRQQAISDLLPRVIKYISRRCPEIVETEAQKTHIGGIRSALAKIEQKVPRAVFWGPSKLYSSSYTLERALANIYWERIVEGVKERQEKDMVNKKKQSRQSRKRKKHEP